MYSSSMRGGVIPSAVRGTVHYPFYYIICLKCRVVSLPSNMNFMIFNHRGRAFPTETGLKLK
ncbi:hypothetical protein Hdeb2414_s0009g00309951 [Helianthus debilis subsp. tardiflorus]